MGKVVEAAGRATGLVPSPEDVDVAVEDIDPAPAAAVRENLREGTVMEYAELVAAGTALPPLEVYAYQGADRSRYLLADGRHRLEGMKKAGRAAARCSVRWCESREAAERRAWEHAAGANDAHGLRRSHEDKRAAVRAILPRPEHEGSSDRVVAELCRVDNKLVRLVREAMSHEGRLTGEAHASTRGYKPDAELRRGYVTDGKGNLIPKPESHRRAGGPVEDANTTPPPGATAPAGRDHGHEPAELEDANFTPRDRSAPSEGTRRPVATADPAAGLVTEPPAVQLPEPVFDHFGRPVPERLRGAFGARDEFRAIGRDIDAARRRAESLFESDGGHGRALVISALRANAQTLKSTIEAAEPYCVCPGCDGVGLVGQSRCERCTPKGATPRGWLTRSIHDQLTTDLRRRCREWQNPPPAREPAALAVPTTNGEGVAGYGRPDPIPESTGRTTTDEWDGPGRDDAMEQEYEFSSNGTPPELR